MRLGMVMEFDVFDGALLGGSVCNSDQAVFFQAQLS